MSQVGQMSQNSEERRQALNDSQRLRQKAQRQPGVADALRAFYLSPFRADLLPASIDPHRLERQRRARLFSLIVTVLTLIQLGSACAQIATAAPTEVVMGQIAIVALSLVCLSLNRAGWTTVASVLYLGGSIAGVTFASTETGAALDLRGLMILSILLIFIVLSGLLLPRWAIWVIAAVCAGVVLYTLRTRRLVETAAGEEATRATLIGIFLIILLALATLTWIASRSTFAGLSTLAAAVEREHELAALKDLFIMDVNHDALQQSRVARPHATTERRRRASGAGLAARAFSGRRRPPSLKHHPGPHCPQRPGSSSHVGACFPDSPRAQHSRDLRPTRGRRISHGASRG
jgi:hypothetical protein